MRLTRRPPTTSRRSAAVALLRLAERAGACPPNRGKAVAAAAVRLADATGMRRRRRLALYQAGLLIDVGLVGLSPDDYEQHPLRGLEAILDLELDSEVLSAVMHHHERFDGTGYPMGFTGKDIPEFARILAIADACDRMTRAELVAQAGTYFDPELVAVYNKITG